MTKFLEIKATEPQITLYEVHGTRQRIDANTGSTLPTAKVRVAVKANERDNAVRTLLSGLNTANPGRPALWPFFTITGEMYCTSVVDSVDGGEFSVEETERIQYQWHFLDLSYACRLGKYFVQTTSQGGGHWYVEDSWEPRTEIRRVNNIDLEWIGGSRNTLTVTPDEAPGISMNSAILTHIVSGYRAMNPEWYKLINTVANAPYFSQNLRRNFNTPRLLLEHMSITEDFSHNSYLDIGGQTTFTIHCRYGVRDDWNKFFRSDGTSSEIDSLQWFAMKNNNTQLRVYTSPLKDHSEILF